MIHGPHIVLTKLIKYERENTLIYWKKKTLLKKKEKGTLQKDTCRKA